MTKPLKQISGLSFTRWSLKLTKPECKVQRNLQRFLQNLSKLQSIFFKFSLRDSLQPSQFLAILVFLAYHFLFDAVFRCKLFWCLLWLWSFFFAHRKALFYFHSKNKSATAILLRTSHLSRRKKISYIKAVPSNTVTQTIWKLKTTFGVYNLESAQVTLETWR